MNQGFVQGPVHNAIKTCIKYIVWDVVKEAIEMATYCPLLEWKRKVKALVMAKDFRVLAVTAKVYKSLDMINNDSCNMSTWWVYAHVCPWNTHYVRSVIKLLLNTYRFGKERCKLCNSGLRDTVVHILFNCEGLRRERQELWLKVCMECPGPMIECMDKMNNDGKTRFTLNGFNCNFEHEWICIYNVIC